MLDKTVVLRLDALSIEHRKEYQLPEDLVNRVKAAGDPPVGALPNCLGYCYANGLRWSPLPVIQQNMNSTAYLDKRCAEYLDEKTGPKFTIYGSTIDLQCSFGQVDQRNPVLEAPLTALALLRHYRLIKEYDDPAVLLLGRRSMPAAISLIDLGSQTCKLNQWTPVPKYPHFLLGRIKLSPNIVGYTLPKLYRLEPLMLDIVCRRGLWSYRLIPSNLSSGIFLNCVPNDFHEMAELLRGVKANPVFAFRIRGPGSRFFKRSFDIEWVGAKYLAQEH